MKKKTKPTPEDILYSRASPEVHALQRQAKRELRLKARAQWKQENLQ